MGKTVRTTVQVLDDDGNVTKETVTTVVETPVEKEEFSWGMYL